MIRMNQNSFENFKIQKKINLLFFFMIYKITKLEFFFLKVKTFLKHFKNKYVSKKNERRDFGRIFKK